MKLGKKLYQHDHRHLQLRDYFPKKTVPVSPNAVDWTKGVDLSQPMLNLDLGDCTCAAPGHQICVWTKKATGNEIIVPDTAVLKAYEDVGGYKPGQPSTDQGAVILDVLKYWRTTGIGSHLIDAFVQVEPKHRNSMRAACWLFGGVNLGIQLPLTAQDQTNKGKNWVFITNSGNGAPGSWGGHCVPILAYNQHYVLISSWGKLIWVSYQFLDHYCDEAWAVLSKDWINAKALSASGFSYSQLQMDLNQVTQ